MSSILKNSELTSEKADSIVSETLNNCDDGELYIEDTKSETIVLAVSYTHLTLPTKRIV